jgi:hypothetical protein
MLNDPVYVELVQYFQNGGQAAVNPNADRFDVLCVALTAFGAASLFLGTPTEDALINIHSLMQRSMTQAQSLHQVVSDAVNFLSPVDNTITTEKVEADILEVLLPDFTVSYIDPWIIRAQQIPTDPTLPADMQSFYDTQVANLAYYQQQLDHANSALTAMSNASSPSAKAMMPPALKTILSKLAELLMPFGKIGLTPGEEYKKSKKAATPTATPDMPAPNAGSSPPAAEAPTPPPRPSGPEAGAVAPSRLG